MFDGPKIVSDCIDAIDPISDGQSRHYSEASSEKFFFEWFFKRGAPRIFIFNQNVRTTDIQYAELLALLRLHTFQAGNHQSIRPDFTNSTHLKSVISSYFSAASDPVEWKDCSFSERLWLYLQSRVVVDAYFGSCSVYPPPHLDMSAGGICGESGYIHSMGKIISLRNATKLTENEIFSFADQFLQKENDKTPIFLVPYCHEDFTAHDRETPFLRHGLDDIKLHLAKSSIGNTPLANALETFARQINKQHNIETMVAPSGSYKEARAEFSAAIKKDVKRTWFWIIDSEMQLTQRTPSDKKYYILYEQLIHNQNPYHWFDENKPAWVSHTTLPHSLCAAMINVSRPWWPEGRNVSICDPFGGSGTTYLEAQRFNNCEVYSFDLAAAAKRITEDNVSTFARDAKWYNEIINRLEVLETDLRAAIGFTDTKNQSQKAKNIRQYRQAAEKVINDTNGDCLKANDALWASVIPKGAANTLEWRIIMYTFLRGYIRHQSGIERGNEHPHIAIAEEAQQLITSFKGIANIYSGKKLGFGDIPAGMLGSLSSLEAFNGSYSHVVRPVRPRLPDNDLFGTRSFVQSDVRNLPQQQFDLIVCDPPYGFNTDEEKWSMADLYTEMIEAMQNAIHPAGGQIVMAVPEESFTGKPIPYFARPRSVIDEFFRILKKTGRHAYKPAVLSPTKANPYEPPYYWYSEKALKRSILHFWLE